MAILFGCEMVWWRGDRISSKDALGTGLNFRRFSLKGEIIVALLSISEIGRKVKTVTEMTGDCLKIKVSRKAD